MRVGTAGKPGRQPAARPGTERPGDAEARRADALLAAGEHVQAAALYGELAQRFPKQARWQGGLARAAAARADWPETLRALEAMEALGRQPDLSELRLRGRALVALRRPVEAEPVLRGIVAAAPRDQASRVVLAQLLFQLGRGEDGLAALDGVPAGTEALRVRMQLLLLAQRAAEARDLFAAAVAAATTPTQIGRLIGTAARLHGAGPGYRAACRMLQARLQAMPAARAAPWVAARLHLALGETDGFRAAARIWLRRKPEDPLAAPAEAVLRVLEKRPADTQRRRVFVVGLSKTGTTSVTAALEKLGWAAQHWVNALTGLMLTVQDAAVFEAMTDTPVADMAEELAAAWPDALFILTRRPVEAWARSWEAHFRRDAGVQGIEGLRRLTERPDLCPLGLRWAEIHERLYTRHPDLPTAFAAHDARIRALFADQPNRLLEFDLVSGDGWEKLCGFLGVPVPDGPFPRENARPDPAA